jgi:hypothetical protein
VNETAMMNLFDILPSTERMALLIVGLLAAVSLLCGVFSWGAHESRRKSPRRQGAMIRMYLTACMKVILDTVGNRLIFRCKVTFKKGGMGAWR